MGYSPIWEPGDEAVRPTQKPWKCPDCGVELYMRASIESHKRTCAGQKTPEKSEYEIEREKQLQESLRKFRLKRMRKRVAQRK